MKQEYDLVRPETQAPLAPTETPPGPRRFLIPILVVIALLGLWRLRSQRTAPAAGGAGSAAVKIVTPPTPVEEATVTTGPLIETVEVSGDIAALTEVTLSSKITARVVTVAAREGDRVRRGQLLITLDTSDLDSQLRSAEDALAGANARAQQALVAARWQQQSAQLGIQTAQETLRSADARLQAGQTGARAQERLVSQSAVNLAQANLDDAITNYNRTLRLFKDGAVAQAAVDTADTRVKVSRAQLDSAQQQLSLINEGTRREDIVQLEATVEQAKQGLRQAEDNQRQVAMKWADYRSAAAAVRQAQAAVTLAQQNRANAFIHSSVDGVVARRSAEPGQMAAPGSPLLRITVPGTVFFSATVSERDLGRVRAGQPVEVGVDAFPSERFAGRITQIYPTGDTSSRTFTVRITLSDAGGRLRPGMFARGAIQVSRRENVVLLPKAALSVGGSSVPLAGGTTVIATVFIARDGVAVRKSIKIGSPSDDRVEVRSGLEPGDRVIVSGSHLEEGQKVDVTH